MDWRIFYTLASESFDISSVIIHYIIDYRDVDLLSAMLNSWATLVKQRPSTLPYLITTLRTWTPAALTGLLASSIKSVEKAVRILLAHISRCVILTSHGLTKN